MPLTIVYMAAAYLLGWVHAKHGSVTRYLLNVYNSWNQVDPLARDKNYCPECEAFLPSDDHKPMCSRYVAPKPQHVWGCPKNPAYGGGATTQGCKACALGLP